MKDRLKKFSLVLCLFTFLFVIVGGGFHLSPGGAFVAAVSGTPLAIYVFNRRSTGGNGNNTARNSHPTAEET